MEGRKKLYKPFFTSPLATAETYASPLICFAKVFNPQFPPTAIPQETVATNVISQFISINAQAERRLS